MANHDGESLRSTKIAGVVKVRVLSCNKHQQFEMQLEGLCANLEATELLVKEDASGNCNIKFWICVSGYKVRKRVH